MKSMLKQHSKGGLLLFNLKSLNQLRLFLMA